ncbi:DUF4276 family protein [Gluconobacter albidus]|uniref:DUF4276 family protein n=1 Tax=Gluconobacter albidus TaxID=318683 RepID=UPI0009E68C89|nr:DUF4276 family protein [Gluconobacter albidus]
MTEKIIFFVEEPSAKEALQLILPKIVGDLETKIINFQCKDDLKKNLKARLAGYTWIPSNWKIFVLVDRDDDNCRVLKGELEQISLSAGLLTKTSTGAVGNFHVINRIIIEELEAWFFGDWGAVRTAYPRVPATVPNRSPYRDPDSIAGGTWEALERLMQRAGYYHSGLRKIECARNISKNMSVDHNNSRSFVEFRDAVRHILHLP